MHKIGESTSHVTFNAKTNGLQITQEKQGGTNCQVCKKYQLFLWSNGMVTGNIFRAKVVTNKKLDKYLAILTIGENLENHDDGRMKKKLNFS